MEEYFFEDFIVQPDKEIYVKTTMLPLKRVPKKIKILISNKECIFISGEIQYMNTGVEFNLGRKQRHIDFGYGGEQINYVISCDDRLIIDFENELNEKSCFIVKANVKNLDKINESKFHLNVSIESNDGSCVDTDFLKTYFSF